MLDRIFLSIPKSKTPVPYMWHGKRSHPTYTLYTEINKFRRTKFIIGIVTSCTSERMVTKNMFILKHRKGKEEKKEGRTRFIFFHLCHHHL